MDKLQLYKTPSLVASNSSESIEIILQNKVKEYDYNQSKIQDYIGKSFNSIQTKINDLTMDKVRIEEQIKKAKEIQKLMSTNIALALENMGIDVLDDKTADISSSIKVTPPSDSKVELKERPLTHQECKDLLKANGLQVTIVEEVQTESKPIALKVNYKRGAKIAALTPSKAKEQLTQIFLNDEVISDESTNNSK